MGEHETRLHAPVEAGVVRGSLNNAVAAHGLNCQHEARKTPLLCPAAILPPAVARMTSKPASLTSTHAFLSQGQRSAVCRALDTLHVSFACQSRASTTMSGISFARRVLRMVVIHISAQEAKTPSGTPRMRLKTENRMRFLIMVPFQFIRTRLGVTLQEKYDPEMSPAKYEIIRNPSLQVCSVAKKICLT